LQALIKFLKGSLIGLSVIAPGVSGGFLAMSMGIYDQLIEFASLDKGNFRRGLKEIFPYALGGFCGILLFSYFIELALHAFPFPTFCAFIGLILGVLPSIVRKLKGHGLRLSRMVILLLAMAVMIAVPLLSRNAGVKLSLEPVPLDILLSAGLGLIVAATLVIPGLSGSAILLLIGYYDSLLSYVNQFTAGIFHLNGASVLDSLLILIPFAVGTGCGIILICRMIRTLLKKYPISSYYGILGLVLASPFAVLYQIDFQAVSTGSWVIGILCVIAGFTLAAFMEKGEQ